MSDLYKWGRLNAPVSSPGSRLERVDDALIEHLRMIREQGLDAMRAADQYDPDLSVKLSNCETEEEAAKVLGEWYDYRAGFLRRTQQELRDSWAAAAAKRRSV